MAKTGNLARCGAIEGKTTLLLRLCLFLLSFSSMNGFLPPQHSRLLLQYHESTTVLLHQSSAAGQGFGVVADHQHTLEDTATTTDATKELLELSSMDTMEIKRKLLHLLPNMMGTTEDFRLVESYVNTLEERYSPVHTLDFLNLALGGEWQLLFSTNLLSKGPRPHFRLRELKQHVEADGLEGVIENKARWDLAEDGGSTFDASGTFTAKCSYKINQGARMTVSLKDHVLELSKGSKVPSDVEGLVGLLHRAMPNEMFDPTDHIMDTTYLDGDLRIVRMSGPRFEGVRDILIRTGSLDIDHQSQE